MSVIGQNTTITQNSQIYQASQIKAIGCDFPKKMLIKILILLIVTLMMPCSQEENDAFKNFSLEDNLKLIIFKNGRETKKLTPKLLDKEKLKLENWISSFANLKDKDLKSYASVIFLLGKQIKINFQNGRTVVSTKKDNPQALWNQYSRATTQQDEKIVALLKNKI